MRLNRHSVEETWKQLLIWTERGRAKPTPQELILKEALDAQVPRPTQTMPSYDFWVFQWPIILATKNQGLRPFVLDFLYPKALLCIEVDGMWHYNRRRKNLRGRDQERDRLLGQIGVHVMRFTNRDIQAGLPQALDEIQRRLEGRLWFR